MADYFAVLNKTLAGFGEPSAQLRTKLYERARVTIRRQLDSRTPAIDESTLMAEMQKLERAIADIESGFPDGVATEPSVPAAPAPVAPAPVQAAPIEPAPVAPPIAEPAPTLPIEGVQPAPTPSPAQPPAIEQPLAQPHQLSRQLLRHPQLTTRYRRR